MNSKPSLLPHAFTLSLVAALLGCYGCGKSRDQYGDRAVPWLLTLAVPLCIVAVLVRRWWRLAAARA